MAFRLKTITKSYIKLLYHSIGNKQHIGPLSSATCPPIFMHLMARIMAEQPVQRSYWSEKAIDWPELTCIMKMRNETCVETQTSKIPSRVAFLFLFCACTLHCECYSARPNHTEVEKIIEEKT